MSSHNSPSNGNDGLRQRAPKKIKANNYYCSVNNGGRNEILNTPLLANSSVKCVGSSSAVRSTVNRDSEMIQQIFWRNKQSLDQLQPAQQPLLIPKISPQQYQHIVQESQAKVSMDEHRKVLKTSVISGGATNVGQGANTTMNSMDNDTKLNNFPYYLSKATETLLVGSYFLHMQGKILPNKPKAPCTEHRVMLLGPEGTDVYQETLAMSLAHYFQAKLLVFDCQLNLKDLASGTWSPSSNQALKFELKRLGECVYAPQSPWFSHENSINQSLKRDDRVVFTGIKNLNTTNNIASIGPTFGNRGSVISLVSPTHVGVKFDTSVSRGFNLEGSCEAQQGFVCNVNELCLDLDGEVEPLIRPSKGSNGESNIIVFIKHAVNCMAEVGYDRIITLINSLPQNVFLIGSHVEREFKGNFNAMKEQVFQRALKTFSNIFYNEISIEMPQDKTTFDQLKNQLDEDAELLNVKENISRVCQALLRYNWECDVVETSVMKDLNLTDETAEKVVKMAIGWEVPHLQNRNNSNIRLSRESILSALNTLRASLSNQTNSGTFSKNKTSENEIYEKMVMDDLIHRDQIGVKFDDIGALDNVKEMLKEIVILPLQRPELFLKGLLRKPCRGILLFGPPGTGKTMLAKAVATEAGANFFNITPSSIDSKYGDSEKFVKALFSLARKLAPSVVYLDEVDSIFGKRKESEHEATRKAKNEFMLNWDGLLTKDTESVLVLAATNRPFDLDEAAIRRMPCRCLVDLPDIANRSKILKVILAEDELSCDVDFNKIARMTTDFSGNDLKKLCLVAARFRVNEFVKNEKGKSPVGKQAEIRPLKMQDFFYAFEKVKASVPRNTMSELQQWNELHGGGSGSRTPPNPAHFPPPGFPMRLPNMIVPKSE